MGDPRAEVRRCVVALDRSLGAVAYARVSEAQMVVAHHPLLFEPVDRVVASSHVGRTILELATAGIAFAAAHTNWDAARGGINDALAAKLGLGDVRAFGTAAEVPKLKLVVFSPEEAADSVIDAASEAGAGVIGEYSRCAFMSPGTGTFFGSASAKPAVGESERREEVAEVRIEMILDPAFADSVGRAVRRVHPYEEPAMDFLVLRSIREQPAGRVGSLTEPITLAELGARVDRALETCSWVWGDGRRSVRRVAVVGGAADSEWRSAQRAGADVLVTGEVKQHVALEAVEEGFAILAAGHYATEQPGCAALCDRLRKNMPEVEWLLFVPEPGQAGRPLNPTAEIK